MSRYITIPKPATFIDPGNKKTATIKNEAGEQEDLQDRDHEWFLHVFMLSHLQFNIKVGGVEATRAKKDIERALAKALLEEQSFYEVSDDSLARLKLCMACATDEEYAESRKPEPNPRILAKSTLGMQRTLDNFTASCFMEHFDAIENATTVKPNA